MKRRMVLILALAALLLPRCADDSAADDQERLEMRTIENTPTELKPVRKPPMIEFDGGPAPELTGEDAVEEEAPQPSEGEEGVEEDESAQWTRNLPFSPKIAMDPVDGSKLSIRRTTPTAEYKGRIYYFSSEANRREFIRSPDDFLSGAFSSY